MFSKNNNTHLFRSCAKRMVQVLGFCLQGRNETILSQPNNNKHILIYLFQLNREHNFNLLLFLQIIFKFRSILKLLIHMR